MNEKQAKITSQVAEDVAEQVEKMIKTLSEWKDYLEGGAYNFWPNADMVHYDLHMALREIEMLLYEGRREMRRAED